MKFMILGAGGLMGRHLIAAFQRADIHYSAYTHCDLDIRDAAAAARVMTHERPEWVINCAALCSFDACEEDPELSKQVNLEAPLLWARLCSARGARLVHFSSDYIFDGGKREPYGEGDAPAPRSVYAAHKAATEEGFGAFPQHLILRVAWLFGAGSRTFMSQIPRLLMIEEELTVASGKKGNCLYAGYGADLAVKLILSDASGIVNTVHTGETAWEEFAEECLAQLKARGMEPRCQRIRKVPFEEMPSMKSGRPPYSVLSTAKLSGILGYEPVTWQEGIGKYLNDLFPMTVGDGR